MKKQFLNKLFNLENKKVIVTGATGQLGSIMCKAYLDVGARVVGIDKQLNRKKMMDSKEIKYVCVDITEVKALVDLFTEFDSKKSGIDVLINNAGVSVFEPFEERTGESFDHVTDVNLKGTFLCIQNYTKYIRKSGHKGNIINIASFYGVISPDFRIYTDCERRNSEVYGATKAGIIQMTKYFAVHLARYNIRVNCISPGGILNPECPQGEDFIKNYSYRCPMGRLANAEEIIGALLYLSSDAATYTTGQNILIDGGMSCW